MKICPKCGSTRVITFTADDDICEKCGKWFPAVAEIKCVASCKAFTGGEIKHHKDCYFYPESFTKMYDDEKKKNKKMQRDIKRIIVEIQAEMLKNVGKPNFGKNGCLTRLNQLLDGKFKGTSEEIYSEEESPETEQPKTIEWYDAQVEELMAIRKVYSALCETNEDDAYFPDLIEDKLNQLKKKDISEEGIAVAEELIIKLADDVWAVAKILEDKRLYSAKEGNYDLIKDLKTISGCLHDLRAGRKTKWYYGARLGQ